MTGILGRQRFRLVFGGVVLAAWLSVASVNSSADPLEENSTQAASGAFANCTGTVDSPHYSSGARGVIFKARATCSSTKSVTVTGKLYFYTNTWVLRYQGTQTRAVGTSTATFYFPPSGQVGAGPPPPWCNGTWRAAATFSTPGTTPKTYYRDAFVQWC